MKAPDPLLKTVRDLRDLLYRMAREWEATVEEVDDPDASEALTIALSKGYPLGSDIDELVAAMDEWAEHVEQVLDTRPSALQLAAAEINADGPAAGLTPRVTADLADLLRAVDAGDPGQIQQTADRLARRYRAARRTSHT
jgi:hypothetical protein